MKETELETVSNESGNRPFADVLSAGISRRKVLRGGLGLAATGMFVASPISKAFARSEKHWHQQLIGFRPVTLAEGGGALPAVSPDYDYEVILPWGDPVEPSGPAFSLPIDPAAQALQIGIGHDGMWFFPMVDERSRRYGWDELVEHDPWRGRRLRLGLGSDHGLLCINHD